MIAYLMGGSRGNDLLQTSFEHILQKLDMLLDIGKMTFTSMNEAVFPSHMHEDIWTPRFIEDIRSGFQYVALEDFTPHSGFHFASDSDNHLVSSIDQRTHNVATYVAIRSCD
ncbi:hypothetical protein A4G21_04230 [Brucella intermedia]|nr:hypothetical protein A4G21_04230 [Brucella intermedia]